MPKYARQKDHHSCGAYAILNSLKWLGRPATEKILPRIWKLSEYPYPKEGMPMLCLEKVLTKLKIKWDGQYRPKIKDINRRLDAGEAFILVYYYNTRSGHYTLCVNKTPQYYTLINNSKIKTTCKIHKDKMKKMLHDHREYYNKLYPMCWFIKK
jgi:hypothetical protein